MKEDSIKLIYQPVVIIGAGRSGTNMLRDLLIQLPGFGTWPCDEINYIWRHGNIREDTDEFGTNLATVPVQIYIRHAFSKLAQRQFLSYIVEKTCANSLRVEFVHRVFPNAWFIHLVRDGRDVVNSAQKRWTAPLDLPYLLQKARFVPVTDLPYYSSRYLSNRIYRLFSRERRVAFWGPCFTGMTEMLQYHSLVEVCAMQWQRCVSKAEQGFRLIDTVRVHQLRYEDIVTHPESELRRLGAFLDVDISEQKIRELAQHVSPKSIGNWKKELDQKTLSLILPLMCETLEQYGYL
jgi:hypothetical protein